jgi:SAM-dependent methyltransferase
MVFLSKKTWQFTYFALQLGESMWRGKDILDFGGNIGNILRDPNSTIDVERYWCIDVDKDALERARASFPKSHWVYYNRYCFFFNPHGIPNLTLPDLDQAFDYIVAYSVFANTTPADMLQLVNQLEGLLAKNGALAFTFIDPHYFSWPGKYHGNNFEWRLEREKQLAKERGTTLDIDVRDLTSRAKDADWLMLVNGDDLYIKSENIRPYEPEQQQTCHAFYSEEYMKILFPHATVLPPVNQEMQHCCVIRKS